MSEQREEVAEQVHNQHMDLIDFESSYLRVGLKTEAQEGLSVALSQEDLLHLRFALDRAGIIPPGVEVLRRFVTAAVEWARANPGKVAIR